jgi:hypothetical protein
VVDIHIILEPLALAILGVLAVMVVIVRFGGRPSRIRVGPLHITWRWPTRDDGHDPTDLLDDEKPDRTL